VSLVRVLTLFLALSALHARRLPIKTYTTADGLARDRVQCIVQDPRGFLWFCTKEGLSRFDGYRFVNYGVEQGLPSANVSALLAARSGMYWVGTPAGVCRFDPRGRSSPKFRCQALPGGSSSQVVYVLIEGRDGTVWCGTEGGLYQLPPPASSFQRVILGEPAEGYKSAVEALLEDRRGVLWVSTRDGLWRRSPDGSATVNRSWLAHGGRPLAGVLAMLEDREGRLWLGTTESLLRVDSEERATEFLVGTRVFSMVQSAAGKIWLGTSRGLAERIPGAGPEFEFYDAANGLSGRQVSTVAEDRDGNLWIGSDGGGVMRLAPGGFVAHYAEDGLGELGPAAGSMFETRDGELLFSHGATLSRFDGRRFSPTRPAFPPEIAYFGWGTGRTALQDHLGEWRIATGQGLCRFSSAPFRQLASTPPKAVYRVRDGLPHDNIFQLFEDSRGAIWIGTIGGDGVARWDRGTGKIRAFSADDGLTPVSAATGFAEDRAGNIWVGFYHGGLARYANGRFTMFTDAEGVPKGGQKQLFADSAGRLWVSSRPGFARTDNATAASPRFVSYTTAQGLASNDTYGIAEDAFGRIYVATGRGIDRIEPGPANIGAIRHYTTADGLPPGELRTAYRDRDGDIWFATNVGISQLSPARDLEPHAPSVLVTGLEIGAAPSNVSDVGETEVRGVRVEPGRGPLRIDFVGLSFAPGERMRYQYRLAGVDRDWSARRAAQCRLRPPRIGKLPF
jgi:ligand-binding sensor domain-containing protein